MTLANVTEAHLFQVTTTPEIATESTINVSSAATTTLSRIATETTTNLSTAATTTLLRRISSTSSTTTISSPSTTAVTSPELAEDRVENHPRQAVTTTTTTF